MLPVLSRPRIAVPDPFGIRREMDQLFDQFFGDPFLGDPLFGDVEQRLPLTRGALAPVDMWEEEDCICVEMDLPGVKKGQLDLTIEEGRLHVVAKDAGPAKEERSYWIRERYAGPVERIVGLPESVDPESIDAELHDGILHIKLRKHPEAQPTKIEVRA